MRTNFGVPCERGREPCEDCGCTDYDPQYVPTCACWDTEVLRERVNELRVRGGEVCGALIVSLTRLEMLGENMSSWQLHRNTVERFMENAKEAKHE